jgi:uncharacterized protein (DUF2062 family)
MMFKRAKKASTKNQGQCTKTSVARDMKEKLKAWAPGPETIHNNRWLRWLAPFLKHHALWHFSRRGAALGVAIGIFFGLLIPIAQIPLSVGAAIVLRANVPLSVGSTLISNPLTYGPLWYGSYRLGQLILGAPQTSDAEVQAALASAPGVGENGARSWKERGADLMGYFTSVGKPFLLGAFILASVTGVAFYYLTHMLWIVWVRRKRDKRVLQRKK